LGIAPAEKVILESDLPAVWEFQQVPFYGIPKDNFDLQSEHFYQQDLGYPLFSGRKMRVCVQKDAHGGLSLDLYKRV
jgi:hypothetical protein